MKKSIHLIYAFVICFSLVGSFNLIRKVDLLEEEMSVRKETIHSLQSELENKISFTTPPKNDVQWLALNIYHEARGESVQGMLAVGAVTLNRVESTKYPNSIEEVVKQNKQFSWYWDGHSDVPHDVTSWNTSKRLAEILLTNNNLKIRKKLAGVLHYHATSVKPLWAKRMSKVDKIDNHIFYN